MTMPVTNWVTNRIQDWTDWNLSVTNHAWTEHNNRYH